MPIRCLLHRLGNEAKVEDQLANFLEGEGRSQGIGEQLALVSSVVRGVAGDQMIQFILGSRPQQIADKNYAASFCNPYHLA